MLLTKEFYDLLAQFEKTYKQERLDREDKVWWAEGHVYQNGYTNDLFKAFQLGYAYCTCIKNLES
jgi:hypothetical protein